MAEARDGSRRERRFGMRLIALIVALLPPATAPAQVLVPAPPPPPVNQEGMRDFCIYGNQLYSLGAAAVRSQLECRHALRCERGGEIGRAGVLELRYQGVADLAGLALRERWLALAGLTLARVANRVTGVVTQKQIRRTLDASTRIMGFMKLKLANCARSCLSCGRIFTGGRS
jgi:hypothetical protein